MADNFQFAPPVKAVDGLKAVPIDIQQLDAKVVFDAQICKAKVDATVQFVMGNADGNPIFDLRQTIQEAYLNGVSLSPDRLKHHDFGGGPDAELRIIDAVVTAESKNILRLVYELNKPQSPQSQPIGWDSVSKRLYWDLWFSDLWPARYLEMWFPSNLIYDQFKFNLEIAVINSSIDHSLFTNGHATLLEQNHWSIEFPERFTSLSFLLVIAAKDTIDYRKGVMTIPATGSQLYLDTFKLTGTLADLNSVENNIKNYIAGNINKIGPYIHGSNFTSFIWTSPRSMEYDGGVTSNVDALEHEVFHSWFARGIKPATQNDGWIDEGWTVYNVSSCPQSDPFSMSEPPVMLSSLNPFNRITPGTAYSSGCRFFSGLAALLGVSNLQLFMNSFYRENQGKLYSTEDLEAYLISKSGIIGITDYFERFVYGYAGLGSGPNPDLYIRKASDDSGIDQFIGSVFWNSPDIWIRNDDDGGSVHQNPISGRDNWFYARVHNRGKGAARTFVVTFNVKTWLGTEFLYPGDFLQCINAVAGFNLASNEIMIVKAKWPKELVPAAGTHGCMLVSVYTPTDKTASGIHVWECNNLAQKNLVILNVLQHGSVEIPIQLGSLHQPEAAMYRIEIRRPEKWSSMPVEIIHEDPDVIKKLYRSIKEFKDPFVEAIVAAGPFAKVTERTKIELGYEGTKATPVSMTLAPGSIIKFSGNRMTNQATSPEIADNECGADLKAISPEEAYIEFKPGPIAGFPVLLEKRSPVTIRIKITAPLNATPGENAKINLVQRNQEGHVVGGITIQLNIIEKDI